VPISRKFGTAAKAAAGFAAVLGAQEVLSWAGDAIQLASAAEEVDSKFQAVFGTNEELKASLREWGDVAGVTETNAENLAATFGNLATAQGISREAAGALALDVATLAGDMASFNDADPAKVFEDINKGMLTTEREGLKKYGIAVSEAEVKQRALTLATEAGRTEVTQADRAMASYDIIVRQAGKAVGDLARTSDSAANKQRQLAAEFKEVQEEVGKALLPVYNDLLGVMLDLAPAVGAVAGAFSAVTTPIGEYTSEIGKATDTTNTFGDRTRAVYEATIDGFGLMIPPVQLFRKAIEENFGDAEASFEEFGDTQAVIAEALRDNLNAAMLDAAAASRDLNAANGELEASRVEEFTRRTRDALNDVIGAYRDAEEAARRFGSLDFVACGVGDDRPSEEQSYENRQGTPSTKQ
jgi:hypothetical protein